MLRLATLPALALTAAVLAGCGETDNLSGSVDPTPAAETAGEAAGLRSTKPTAEQRANLVAALNKIDERMADNPDRYVMRARDTCRAIRQGDKTEDELVAVTVVRFSGGTMPDFSEGQAKKALEAVRGTFCGA